MTGATARARRCRVGVALLCLAAAHFGCAQGEDASSPDASRSDPALQDGVEDQLEALGYIALTEEPVDPSRSGVVFVDRERAQPGYSLYCNHNEGRADLIDLEGRTINTWQTPNARHWASCKLLPKGDLLVIGTDFDAGQPDRKDDEQRYLMLQSWGGEVLWKRQIPVHHHAARTQDGDILTVGLGYRRMPEVHATLDVREDFLLLLAADGSEKERRSLDAALASRPELFAMQSVDPIYKWGRHQVDRVHVNTAEFLGYPQLQEKHEIYAAGNVLVTSRLQNAIAIIEWRTNRLVWVWGPGEVIGPHDATLLENGNILLLDNGDKARGWSRVIELDPIAKKVVWSYRAPEPGDFFTVARGSVQRLPNGNTLITDSNHGRAFEVTKSGEIVWDFLNPHLSHDDKRPSMRRVERYLPEFVEPILERFE